MRDLRVLICEPWFAGSHRSWAEGLARHSTHRTMLVTLPGAFWKWRMQGGALTLAGAIDAEVAANGPPDALLVSDMVHLPALLGLARRSLAGVPVALYMHENQLTYPQNPEGPGADGAGGGPDLTYAMVNWLSMVAADRVVFNSDYHRRAWFEALPAFLGRFPDQHHHHRIDEVRDRSTVLPVGIEAPAVAPRSGDPGRRPTVLWNHRWEWDKDPAAFVDALVEVSDRGVEFDLVMAGQSFATVPEPFDRVRRQLGHRIVHYGTAEPDHYRKLLARADVVVSTARHEFFGVAVIEAVAAGAMPLLPDRLAYPELVPSAEPFLYRDRAGLVAGLCRALSDHHHRRAAADRARRHAARFHWTSVGPAYDDLLSALAR